MEKIESGIEGLFILEPKVYGDHRGYFMESFNNNWFEQNVAKTVFVQDNESKSSRGVLRGLHYQKPPYDQAKLVRVIDGEVLDVVVDLRKSSKSYGMHFAVKLSGVNKKQLFVPRGFAHGFVVLSESAIFSYKVDNSYSPEQEDGLIWNDKTLGIDWQMNSAEILLSDKDKLLQAFNELDSPFE